MDVLEQWTLDQIRSDEPAMAWLEERRFDFVPPAKSSITRILNGSTIIIITDKERAWFANYIETKINHLSNNRPFIAHTNIEAFFPHIDTLLETDDLTLHIDMIHDTLDMAFKGQYFFWYIGKGNDRRCDIAKRSDRSLMWIMDEELQNSFLLQSFDKQLDIKLIQLYALFDRTLSGALFAEFDL